MATFLIITTKHNGQKLSYVFRGSQEEAEKTFDIISDTIAQSIAMRGKHAFHNEFLLELAYETDGTIKQVYFTKEKRVSFTNTESEQ